MGEEKEYEDVMQEFDASIQKELVEEGCASPDRGLLDEICPPPERPIQEEWNTYTQFWNDDMRKICDAKSSMQFRALSGMYIAGVAMDVQYNMEMFSNAVPQIDSPKWTSTINKKYL